MEEIKKGLEELRNLAKDKENVEKLKENIKTKKAEIEKLNEKAKLKMVGTVGKEFADAEVQNAKKELEEIQNEEKTKKEELNENFLVKKENAMSKITAEMAKYKRKSELDQLQSSKRAYERVAENAQKTVEKIIKDFNDGKMVDQSMLSNAKNEVIYNKAKAEEIGKKLDGYIEIESNLEQYEDLEYLKTRIQGIQLHTLNENIENKFMEKYFKEPEKEPETINDQKDEKNQEKDEKQDKENNKPEMQEKIEKVKQEMEATNRDYKNIHFDYAPGINPDTKLADKIQQALENNKAKEQETVETNRDSKAEPIAPKTDNSGNKENTEKTNDSKIVPIDSKTDINEKKENAEKNSEIQKSLSEEEIIQIVISEREGNFFAKQKNGKIAEFSLEEAIEERKYMFKRLQIGKMCKEIAGGNVKGMLLSTKINPAIVKALNSNKEAIAEYIKCLNEKKELPFELAHDLRNSKLGIMDKIRMWRCARAEDKIPGTTVRFATRFWNKNKAIAAKSEVTKQEEETRREKLNDREDIKIENPNNEIERTANKSIKEAEKSLAEEVKGIKKETENTEIGDR